MNRSCSIRTIFVALCIAWPAVAAPIGVRLPTVKQLAEAVRGGDEGEIERLARRIGAPRLVRAAGRGVVEAVDTRAGGMELARSIGDPDPSVAAAAAAALCAGVPPAGSRSPSEKLATTLAEPARVRVRALAADEATGVTDRLDLIPCLRAFAGPADRAALDALAASDVEAIRRRARAYGGPGLVRERADAETELAAPAHRPRRRAPPAPPRAPLTGTAIACRAAR